MARRARAWRASNGGGVQGRDRCWYRHLTSRYVDLLDLMSPEELAQTAGKKKQYDPRRAFDRDVLSKVRERLGLKEGQSFILGHVSAVRCAVAAASGRRSCGVFSSSFAVSRQQRGPRRLSTCRRTILWRSSISARRFPDTHANRSV